MKLMPTFYFFNSPLGILFSFPTRPIVVFFFKKKEKLLILSLILNCLVAAERKKKKKKKEKGLFAIASSALSNQRRDCDVWRVAKQIANSK